MGISARKYYFENVWARLVPEMGCNYVCLSRHLFSVWYLKAHSTLDLPSSLSGDTQVAAEVQDVLLTLEGKYFLRFDSGPCSQDGMRYGWKFTPLVGLDL